MSKVRLTETVFRDAHQSLLATRMRTRDMLPIAEKLDEVGFFSMEVWGGATFDSCIRYLNEDPWERLRALKLAMPNTSMQMLLRGQNLVGYRHYADDVVEKFVERAAANGVDIFRIFDAVNDIRNMLVAIKAARKTGSHVQGSVCYTTSPVHTIEQFTKMAVELADLGCDSICIKDMAGLILPHDAYDLVASMKEAVDVPICLHSHCTSGMAPMSFIFACEAGVDIVDTAISPLGWGSSHPPTESIVASLVGTPYDTGLDLRLLTEIKRYFEKLMEVYAPVFNPISARVDSNVLVYQVPGGMLSNLVSQLIEQKALDKYDEVLAEIPRVREDLGYPPLVTPTSQIVGSQAVLNVLTGERYKVVPKEVKDYVKGLYGRSPAEINPKIKAEILEDEEPITVRPADLIPLEYERMKAEAQEKGLVKKEEDILTYALYSQVAEKFLKGEAKEEVLKKAASAEAQAAVTIGKPAAFNVEVDGEAYLVKVAPAGISIEAAEPKAPKDGVTVPMQGVIIRYLVAKGDKVSKGDAVAVLEAMKMENDVCANKEGVVAEIYAEVGETVSPGDILMSID
ncbi:MAG: sodium-extruding oxaloacetate decarboxylase subunit alpha [Methanothrix sp.]|uniref:Pyruvate carboxylase subunit B n=1 Tax=Methanothrix harundinacea TaxID=301375 RepID=A0A117MC77_9EURY|nr:MAG: Pyruvate carboxylase subunit B [Methanothrix harundinacea]MDD2638211.1 sodium-extruding oxaloacetate decarboxylase subunit alpha [Methanothrix sp.]MDI9398426.1 sodium-extruding oxaloacetate decarboxylase subunit alpha [Euryarchaeota archaeon]KUK96054.1 MAG: Pyruvate carboxylase subunit B [Methanothrix harundinacea]MCP1393013.1 sodium-extruding oxaloacetate decarboxylase subunit alpha [Methanothrix harundinacea]